MRVEDEIREKLQTAFQPRELVVVDDTLRQLIHDRASEQELTGYARRKAPSIRDDAVAKILQECSMYMVSGFEIFRDVFLSTSTAVDAPSFMT